ncbi:hypothetical protein [Pseudoponticoccus marisrubri]|uniref:hypothetical protein n=1 Tax=Pseudoponticoccus marisrubri TaxID=1685382 RepID=UPI0012FE6B91|nr:hypothetical protein [Pseudoponticoccus marisrubri]
MTPPRIHTRPDGSIDTAFYMARGRRMRSEAAHRLMGRDERRPRHATPRAPLV